MTNFKDFFRVTKNIRIVESLQGTLKTLKNKTPEEMKDAYLATLLASLVIIRVGDHKGRTILRDTSGKSLKKYSNTMSPLNFWGMVVFNPDNSSIKGNLDHKTFSELEVLSGRILSSRISQIHDPLSNGSPINWESMSESLRVITLRFELRSPRINLIRQGLYQWETLSTNDKNSVGSTAFNYLLSSDPNSPLLPRLREILNKKIYTPPTDYDDYKNFMIMVNEDDGAATTSGDVSGDLTAGPVADGKTTSQDIAVMPVKLFKGKVIRRRPRRFKKRNKFRINK